MEVALCSNVTGISPNPSADRYRCLCAGQHDDLRSPVRNLNPEQCAQVWSKAVPSGEYLAEANAAPYIVNFKQADGPDQDGKISKSEFEDACAKGLVKFTDR